MNIKRIWLVLPCVLMPYVTLGSLVLFIFALDNSILGAIMDKVFNNNGLFLFACMLIYTIISLVLIGVCFVVSIIKNWNALSIAKTAMIIKLIQIPAYIMIYIFGICFMITIITAPFSIVLFVLDYLALMMTGALNIAAVILAVRQRSVTIKESIWAILLQFVFYADVVASIAFYITLKNKIKKSIIGEKRE